MDNETEVENGIEVEHSSEEASDTSVQNTSKKHFWLGSAAAIVAVLVLVSGVMVYYVGASIRSDRIVARVNGINITASEVRVMMGQAESALMWDYFGMFPEDTEIDHDREFKDGLTFGRVLREESVRLAAIIKLQEDYARQMGITVTDDERLMISEHIDSLIEHFGPEEFEEILISEGFVDRGHVASIFEFEQLYANMLQEILANPEAFANFEPYMDPEEVLDEELLAAKHILAMFDNFDSEAEAENYALNLLERVLAGEDFDMLIREYGQDPGMEVNPGGYTFVSGVMVAEFEHATSALEIGEVSSLVRSDFGFHIIMRVEPDEDDVMRPWGMEPMSLEQRMSQAVQRRFEAKLSQAEVVFRSALDNIPIVGLES